MINGVRKWMYARTEIVIIKFSLNGVLIIDELNHEILLLE